MESQQVQEILKAKPHLKAVQTPDTNDFRSTFPSKVKATLERYEELNNAENDPKTPYKTKYEARKLLEDQLGTLLIGRVGVAQASKKTGSDQSTSADFLEELGGIQALLELRLAENYTNTEETSRGYDYLFRSLEWYCPKSSKRDILFHAGKTFLDEELPRMRRHAVHVLHNLNLIGAIQSERGEPDEALVVLRKAEDFYDEIFGGNAEMIHTNAKALSRDERNSAAEKNIFTMFFLAQVYAHKNDSRNSARYCKQTLEQQYIRNIGFSWRDWVNNAIGVVDFCMTTGGALLSAANAWLWVAHYIMKNGIEKDEKAVHDIDNKESKNIDTGDTSNEVAAQRQDLVVGILRVRADWQRRSALVRLNAFRIARSSRINHVEEPDKVSTADAGTFYPQKLIDAVTHEFSNREDYQALTPFMGPDGLKTREDAWACAKSIIQSLSASQKLYVLDGFVTEYTEMQMEKSKVYLYLCEWEMQTKSRLTLHKRRLSVRICILKQVQQSIDSIFNFLKLPSLCLFSASKKLLEPLLDQLSSAAFEDFCRQIAFELGECYTQLIDLKEEKFLTKRKLHLASEGNNKYLPSLAERRNFQKFCIGCITHYEKFVRLFDSQGKPPEKVEEYNAHPFLVAHLSIARTYGRVPTWEITPNVKVPWLVKSLEKYRWILDNAAAHLPKDQPNMLSEELRLAREAANLLPMQISRLQHLGQ